MQTPLALCVLVTTCLALVAGDVVANFYDIPECYEFFHKGRIPDLGKDRPGVVHICHRFHNQYHFATLYDTHHRIAVYSAYIFEASNGGGREKRWFVEPQVSPRGSVLHQLFRRTEFNDLSFLVKNMKYWKKQNDLYGRLCAKENHLNTFDNIVTVGNRHGKFSTNRYWDVKRYQNEVPCCSRDSALSLPAYGGIGRILKLQSAYYPCSPLFTHPSLPPVVVTLVLSSSW